MNRSVKELLLRANAATIVQPSLAAQQDTLFYYFFHGDKYFAGPVAFAKEWQKIPDFDFNSKQLSNIVQKTKLHIAARSDRDRYITVMAARWSAWENSAIRQMRFADPQSLSMQMLAAADFGIIPGQAYRAAWLERAQQTAHLCGPQHVANILYGCAVLTMPLSEHVMDILQKRARVLLGSFNEQDITNIAWACAALHAITGNDVYERLFETIEPRIPSLTLSDVRNQKQIHDTTLWFKDEPVVDNVNKDQQRHDKEMHPYELKIVKRLRAIGFDVQRDVNPIPRLKQAVDYRITRRGLFYDFEVDGPTHFLTSSEDGCYYTNGPTLFRSALCKKEAPNNTIIRLPFTLIDHWLDLKAAPQQRELMVDIIDEARQMGPGAYTAAIDEQTLIVDPLLPNLMVTEPLAHKPAQRQLQFA